MFPLVQRPGSGKITWLAVALATAAALLAYARVSQPAPRPQPPARLPELSEPEPPVQLSELSEPEPPALMELPRDAAKYRVGSVIPVYFDVRQSKTIYALATVCGIPLWAAVYDHHLHLGALDNINGIIDLTNPVNLSWDPPRIFGVRGQLLSVEWATGGGEPQPTRVRGFWFLPAEIAQAQCSNR